MPSLSLRGIPQDIYDGLKALAARNHRSMQEQARLLVPDLCWLEMTSVVGKQVVQGLLSPREAEDLLQELRQLPLRRRPPPISVCQPCDSASSLASASTTPAIWPWRCTMGPC